jgi:hypothetical protein
MPSEECSWRATNSHAASAIAILAPVPPDTSTNLSNCQAGWIIELLRYGSFLSQAESLPKGKPISSLGALTLAKLTAPPAIWLVHSPARHLTSRN